MPEETRLDRQEFQRLSDERLADAVALLAAQRWSAAYYLAGYAVECAAKACVLAYIEEHMEVLFTKRRHVDDCWTHDFDTLVKRAGLEHEYKRSTEENRNLQRNWQTVMDWTEDSRYKRERSQQAAEELLAAIIDAADGVLPWLKNFW